MTRGGRFSMIADWAKLIGRAIMMAALVVGTLVAAFYLFFPAGGLAILGRATRRVLRAVAAPVSAAMRSRPGDPPLHFRASQLAGSLLSPALRFAAHTRVCRFRSMDCHYETAVSPGGSVPNPSGLANTPTDRGHQT